MCIEQILGLFPQMDAEAAALTQQIEAVTGALAKKNQHCQTLKVWYQTPSQYLPQRNLDYHQPCI